MASQELLKVDGESNFYREVLKSELPVVVDFFADWCGPCRVVGPVIESLSKEYAGRATFAKVNVDVNEDLASRYGVQSIPTVIIFRRGEAVARVVGAASPQAYRSKINAAIDGGN